MFKGANWDDVDECFYNSKSGWEEADEALASLNQAAVDLGVTFQVGTVIGLVLNDSKACLGVHIEARGETRTVTADRTVLCTGVYTAKLLAGFAPDWDELQADGRIVACGAVQCTASYPAEEEEKLKGAPFHFLAMWHTHGRQHAA
jgi:sarcosine oxidase/L-pipecolate oxidase